MSEPLFDHPAGQPPLPGRVHDVAADLHREGGTAAANGTTGGAAQPAPLAVPRIISLDLSLTSTGVAGDGWTDTATYPSVPKDASLLRRHTRMRLLRQRILDLVGPADIVAVEGPSYGHGPQAGEHERAGLWWLIVDSLIRRNVTVIVISPSSLKKYATGKGNAGKDLVLMAAASRIPGFDGGNDQADAAWLHQMVLAHYAPALAVPVPAKHREALAVISWPDIPKVA